MAAKSYLRSIYNTSKDTKNIYSKVITQTLFKSGAIQQGQKVCLVGKLIEGVQDFADSLSNEHRLTQGSLIVRGKLSHLSLKRSRLVDETYLKNIILDSKLDTKKLDSILHSIDLDLRALPGGEYGKPDHKSNITILDTVKILLARTLYHEADIFVFSNLFDELAPEDRIELFDNTVMHHLDEQTVVFHSNDVKLIQQADYVLLFRNHELV